MAKKSAKTKTPRKTPKAASAKKTGATAKKPAKQVRAARSKAAKSASAAAPAKTRPETKQAILIARLQRKEGATIAELVQATGWQTHSVRGAISGALKKKLGLAVTSEKLEGRGRIYRIAAEG